MISLGQVAKALSVLLSVAHVSFCGEVGVGGVRFEPAMVCFITETVQGADPFVVCRSM